MAPPLVPQNRRGPKSKNPLAAKTNDVDTSKRIHNKNQTNDKKPYQMLAKVPYLKINRLNLEEYSHLIHNYVRFHFNFVVQFNIHNVYNQI